MTDPETIDVVCPTDGDAVWVPGHGVLRPSGHTHTVPDSDDVRFLLDVGTLQLPAEQPEPTLTELRDRARELKIDGRTQMDRDELVAAIDQAEANAGDTAGGTNPAGVTQRPTARTDAQSSTAGLVASGDTAPAPGTAEEVGRPDLTDVAAERAATRKPRVIGAENQED